MLLKTPCKKENCYYYAFDKGYCKVHQPPRYQSNRKERLPGNWTTIRDIVLRRDEFICYICDKKGADGVDHVVPGDNHSLNNLRAIHHNVRPFCHRKKTSREANARQGHDVREVVVRKEPEFIKWEF